MPVNPTDLQSEASRLNGQQSHGPVTPEGKAKSAKNSYKFGIYSKSLLAAGESQEEFDQHMARLRDTYDCRTGHEEIQLENLGSIEWQLKRVDRQLASIVGTETYAQDLELLSKHRARLENSKAATLSQLTSALRERDKQEREQIEDAAVIRRADLQAGRQRDPRTLGFVFTLQQVDAYIYIKDTLRTSRETVFGTAAASRMK